MSGDAAAALASAVAPPASPTTVPPTAAFRSLPLRQFLAILIHLLWFASLLQAHQRTV
ncbi:MAG: hypothetical protein ACRELA_14970 [Candidatus Rokuibacteriota bacterium]